MTAVTYSCLVLPVASVLTTCAMVWRQVGGGVASGQKKVVAAAPARPAPLSQRPADWCILGYFVLNLVLVTYLVDIEQLIIADPNNAAEVAAAPWPPQAFIKLIHAYSRAFDPVLLARPAWWQATLWPDVLFYGPYYMVGLYAFAKGCAWIRDVTMVYAASIMTIVFIIMMEEAYGEHPTPHFGFVLCLNSPWFVVPACLLLRMLVTHRPFDLPAPAKAADKAA